MKKQQITIEIPESKYQIGDVAWFYYFHKKNENIDQLCKIIKVKITDIITHFNTKQIHEMDNQKITFYRFEYLLDFGDWAIDLLNNDEIWFDRNRFENISEYNLYLTEEEAKLALATEILEN